MMWSYTFYFYPRPPRGGRRPIRTTTSAAIGFLSTPSARRATLLSGYGRVRDDISIHALREEGDMNSALPMWMPSKFLSPPSARRATRPPRLPPRWRIFLSPPSARRATQGYPDGWTDIGISIPALREEGDASNGSVVQRWVQFLSPPSARRATSFGARPCAVSGYFYPRPPRGGRRAAVGLVEVVVQFLSPPSARRATSITGTCLADGTISIPALREEGDSKNRDKISIFKQIIQHSARI